MRVLHTKRRTNENAAFLNPRRRLVGTCRALYNRAMPCSSRRRGVVERGGGGRTVCGTTAFQQLSSFLTAAQRRRRRTVLLPLPWGHYYPKWREIGKASQHMFIAEDPWCTNDGLSLEGSTGTNPWAMHAMPALPSTKLIRQWRFYIFELGSM